MPTVEVQGDERTQRVEAAALLIAKRCFGSTKAGRRTRFIARVLDDAGMLRDEASTTDRGGGTLDASRNRATPGNAFKDRAEGVASNTTLRSRVAFLEAQVAAGQALADQVMAQSKRAQLRWKMRHDRYDGGRAVAHEHDAEAFRAALRVGK